MLASDTHGRPGQQSATLQLVVMIDVIRSWTAAVACALYWGVGGTFFLILSFILGPILPEAQSRRIGKQLIQFAFYWFTRLLRLFRVARCEYVGFEKLDSYQGGLVLAPNHPAIWDAVFIMARIGGLTCILKAALLRNPLVAGGARLARFIANDPPNEMVKRCVKALTSGERLLLFPEGTRTRKKEGPVNEFRGGAAIIARHAGVPIFPVFIETTSDFGSKGWPAWLPDYQTAHIRMTLGTPMVCGEKESAHEFLERLRAAYIAALSRPSA
jgi:1-acyl-sn-glycerol-3-phosphate acyltransferase